MSGSSCSASMHAVRTPRLLSRPVSARSKSARTARWHSRRASAAAIRPSADRADRTDEVSSSSLVTSRTWTSDRGASGATTAKIVCTASAKPASSTVVCTQSSTVHCWR